MKWIISLILSFFFLAFNSLQAQVAYITFKDGSKHYGEILNSNSKSYIIKGENNRVFEVNRDAISKMKIDYMEYDFKTHIYNTKKNYNYRLVSRHEFGINVLGFVNTDINVFYEYRPVKTKMAIRFPMTFGFNSAKFPTGPFSGFTYKNNVFAIGVEPRIYSNKFGNNSYAFGVGVDYLLSNTRFTTNYERMNGIRIMVNNGSVHKIKNKFYIGYDAGVGLNVFMPGGNGSGFPGDVIMMPQYRFRINFSYLN